MQGHRLFALGFRYDAARRGWLHVVRDLELRQLSGTVWRLAPIDGSRDVQLLASCKATPEAREHDHYAQLLDALAIGQEIERE